MRNQLRGHFTQRANNTSMPGRLDSLHTLNYSGYSDGQRTGVRFLQKRESRVSAEAPEYMVKQELEENLKDIVHQRSYAYRQRDV